MKILILDDNGRRVESLVEYLVGTTGVEKDHIFVAPDVYTASALVKDGYYDVLIIDVMIPKRSNGKPEPKHGIDFLRTLNRASGLRKPGRILGITANDRDIARYRNEFAKHCVAITQASAGYSKWRRDIGELIHYEEASSASKAVLQQSVEVITVHGIQTFGSWQRRLERLVTSSSGDLTFHTYKYGLFSFVSFFIPILRMRERGRFERSLYNLFKDSGDRKFIIFCHSFGTFIVYWALRNMMRTKGAALPIHTLVLCGSVLKHCTDWSTFRELKIRVVNECADDDMALYCSQLFGWGVGMGGRAGFSGFNGELMTNRHFPGGHSSFFSDEFMLKRWLPLISLSERPISILDLRTESFLKHSIADKLILMIGPVSTGALYAAVIGALFLGARALFDLR